MDDAQITSDDQTGEMEWSADNINTGENPAFYTYHQRPSKFKVPVRTGMPARALAGSSADDTSIDEEDDGDCGEGTNSSPEYDHAENMDDNFKVEPPLDPLRDPH